MALLKCLIAAPNRTFDHAWSDVCWSEGGTSLLLLLLLLLLPASAGVALTSGRASFLPKQPSDQGINPAYSNPGLEAWIVMGKTGYFPPGLP